MEFPAVPRVFLICAVALAPQKKNTFRGREEGEKVPRKWEEERWPAKGPKNKNKQYTNPKNLLRLFLRDNLARQKKNLNR